MIMILDVLSMSKALRILHMQIAQEKEEEEEEVVGPFVPMITVDDEKETIKIANDSKFGIVVSIWTQG
jgi:acyl-CoA reductase-like NAD-dependent aldehyde dehydrogenase